MEEIWIFFLLWIFSAYFGSFSSWWVSALSIGIMVLMGISPQMAGITFKLWKIGDNIWWLIHFHKHGYIPKQFILGFWITMLMWSAIGSYCIISIPDVIMYFGCGISMFLLSILSFFRKVSIPKNISDGRRRIWYGVHFFISMIGNFFPAGSGIWYYY